MTTVSMTAPTDYSAEADRIMRQRRMAEALQAESMAPMQGASVNGIPVGPSWTQGLAKVLQGYAAGTKQEDADREFKALGERKRTDTNADMSALIAALGGTPAKAAAPYEDSMGMGREVPAQMAQSPQQAMQAAIPNMRTPEMQQAAMGVLMQQLKPKELFSKVDPKDYTPESVAKFGQTNNYADLVPVRKREVVNLGGTSQAVDPYALTPGATMAHTVTPEAILTDDRVKSEGKLNRGVTIRGQDLTNERSVDANGVANANKNVTLTESIRKEFNNLPEVKNYKEVLPIIESVKRAPNTPAGDIDLIYGVGKIMDPNSVVREGELNLVIKAGSPAQKLQGMVSYVQGGGRLAPAQRAELMQVMNSRVGALKANYDAARGSYTDIVTKQGLKPEQVFPNLVSSGEGGNDPFGIRK